MIVQFVGVVTLNVDIKSVVMNIAEEMGQDIYPHLANVTQHRSLNPNDCNEMPTMMLWDPLMQDKIADTWEKIISGKKSQTNGTGQRLSKNEEIYLQMHLVWGMHRKWTKQLLAWLASQGTILAPTLALHTQIFNAILQPISVSQIFWD